MSVLLGYNGLDWGIRVPKVSARRWKTAEYCVVSCFVFPCLPARDCLEQTSGMLPWFRGCNELPRLAWTRMDRRMTCISQGWPGDSALAPSPKHVDNSHPCPLRARHQRNTHRRRQINWNLEIQLFDEESPLFEYLGT
jgi:hypothetical protein